MGKDLEDVCGLYRFGTESIVVSYDKKQNNVYSVQGRFWNKFDYIDDNLVNVYC